MIAVATAPATAVPQTPATVTSALRRRRRAPPSRRPLWAPRRPDAGEAMAGTVTDTARPGKRRRAARARACGAQPLRRSQVTVDDRTWMGAMTPHHSLAIARSERADIHDVRVCQLAVDIIVAQKKEIAEMEWLIEDIRENGEVETLEEAPERPVPEFAAEGLRDCPPAG
ncbi:DUF305 domain-containing protein [Blastococcus sp. SYSU DS0533]